MRRNGTMKSVCALVLIMCLMVGGFAGRAKAQDRDSVAEGIMAAWSTSESTAASAADGIQATAATYGRCVAEHSYRVASGQGQACDIRGLFASDTQSQAEAEYLYGLNTYWLQWSEDPATERSISAIFSPVVTDIQVPLDGQTAVASVTAGWTEHDRSANAAQDQQTTDNSMVCKLTMRFEKGTWRITHEECPADQMRRDGYPMGTDFAQLIREVPARKAAYRAYQEKAEAYWQQKVQEMRETGDPRYAFLSESDRQLAPSPAGAVAPVASPFLSGYTTYNRDRALSYSNQYNSYGTSPAHSGYNGKFYLPSEDCQSFGSQCVWAGFGGLDNKASIDSRLMPMVNSTDPALTWWCTSTGITSPWDTTEGFETMVRANLAQNNYGVQAVCGANNQSNGAAVSTIGVGDIVRWKQGHTMVVVQITQIPGDPYNTYKSILVSAHNTDWSSYPLWKTYAQTDVSLEHIVVYRNPSGA
jgi:hypothetical protein